MAFVWHFLIIVLANTYIKGIIALKIVCLQNHGKIQAGRDFYRSPSNLLLKAGLASKSLVFKVLLPYLSTLDQ